MSTNYYPPPAFYFNVYISGTAKSDASFQEVSGIQVQFEVEKVVEGGENRFAYSLPQRGKYSNLVLKRGYVVYGSALATWVEGTIGAGLTEPIAPVDMVVTLLNKDNQPLASWSFASAYPVRWEVSSLNSMENKILTETLELTYNYFQRV